MFRWIRRGGSAGRIAAIEGYFGQLRANDPDPDRKSFACAILGRLFRRQQRLDDAVAQYQRIVEINHDLWAWYGCQKLGTLLRRKDPDRAIAALEGFEQRRSHLNILGDEPTYLELGRLYTRQRQHAKAEALYRWLLERAGWGEIRWPQMVEQITAGLAGALFGQGKDEEAEALIGPYFAKYRYGTPIEELTLEERSDLAGLLFGMGRFDEAQKLRQIRAP